MSLSKPASWEWRPLPWALAQHAWLITCDSYQHLGCQGSLSSSKVAMWKSPEPQDGREERKHLCSQQCKHTLWAMLQRAKVRQRTNRTSGPCRQSARWPECRSLWLPGDGWRRKPLGSRGEMCPGGQAKGKHNGERKGPWLVVAATGSMARMVTLSLWSRGTALGGPRGAQHSWDSEAQHPSNLWWALRACRPTWSCFLNKKLRFPWSDEKAPLRILRKTGFN